MNKILISYEKVSPIKLITPFIMISSIKINYALHLDGNISKNKLICVGLKY